MLSKQIIRFEWRGSGLCGCTCTPKTGYFQDRNLLGKSLRKLLLTTKNTAGGNIPYFPPSGRSLSQNLI